MKKIEIYGQTGCSYCERAMRFCEDNALPHVYRNIANRADRAEMFRRNTHARTVPQIFIGERLIGGYDNLSGFSVPELQQMIGE